MTCDSIALCERFLRAYFQDHSISDAADCLADDVTWYGDGQIDSAQDKEGAINLLSYGIEFYSKSHVLEDLQLKSRILANTVHQVEGSLVLSSQNAGCIKEYRAVFVVRESEKGLFICSFQFHLMEDSTTGAMNRYLNVLFDTVPCGVLFFEKRENLRLTYFNTLVLTATGYTRDEFGLLVKEDSFGFVCPEDAALVKAQMEHLLKSKEQIDLVYRARAKQGVLWIHLIAHTFDWGKNDNLIIASLIDISGEIQARNQLKSMISNIPGGVVTFEASDNGIVHTFLSDNFKKKIGYEFPDKHDITKDFQLVHPEDLPRVQDCYADVLSGADVVDLTIRIKDKDDRYFWVNLKANMYQADAGKRLFYGIYTDVDAHVRAMNEIESSRKRLESAITSLPGGLGLFRYTRGFAQPVYFNDNLCAIFGMSRDEFVRSFSPNRPFGNLDDAHVRSLINEHLSRDSASTATFGCSAKKQDGTPIYVRLMISSTIKNGDTVYHVIVRDATKETSLVPSPIWPNVGNRIVAEADEMIGLTSQNHSANDFQNALLTFKETTADNRYFALVMVEIETYGENAENGILQQTEQTLRTMPSVKNCCRYGDNSFAFLLTDLSGESELKGTLDDLCTSLNHCFDDSQPRSVSIGCELHHADHYIGEILFIKAAKALDYSKQYGGNQAVIYSDSLKRRKSHPSSEGQSKGKTVFVRTFGHFDVFVDGQAILFPHSKAKELLALLVDRNGGFVSAREAIAYLWEDEPVDAAMQARYRKTAMRLKNILDENGIADMIETIKGKRRVIPAKFDCDYYQYMSGEADSLHQYTGSYLVDYSWAENTISALNVKRSYYSKLI